MSGASEARREDKPLFSFCFWRKAVYMVSWRANIENTQRSFITVRCSMVGIFEGAVNVYTPSSLLTGLISSWHFSYFLWMFTLHLHCWQVFKQNNPKYFLKKYCIVLYLANFERSWIVRVFINECNLKALVLEENFLEMLINFHFGQADIQNYLQFRLEGFKLECHIWSPAFQRYSTC